jgi:hypothetical protein
MATPLPTVYTRYDLSEEELAAAAALSPFTVMWIQTLIGDAAERKLSIPVDPNNIQLFVQEEAYYRGQIDALSTLLNAFVPSSNPSSFNGE